MQLALCHMLPNDLVGRRCFVIGELVDVRVAIYVGDQSIEAPASVLSRLIP